MCISKIDGTTIDDAEDLDLVVVMYNLLEYSSNYSGKTGSLWFYSNDEATNFNVDTANTDVFKSFKHKAKLIQGTVAQPKQNQIYGVLNNAIIAVCH